MLSISDGGDGDGDKMMNGFKDINVPVILTEFGRPDTPRLFAQVDWMFQEGANLINGGMVFRLVQKKGRINLVFMKITVYKLQHLMVD